MWTREQTGTDGELGFTMDWGRKIKGETIKMASGEDEVTHALLSISGA